MTFRSLPTPASTSPVTAEERPPSGGKPARLCVGVPSCSQGFTGFYMAFGTTGVLGFRAGLLAGLGAKDGGRGGRSMVYGLEL